MSLFAPVTQRSRLARREPVRCAEMPARVIAATLAASLALALAGCATPVLQPAVNMPARFAAADSAVERRRRGRLVGELPRSSADRPDSPRRAREPRHQDRQRARPGRASRRNDQSLVAAAEHRRYRRRGRSEHRVQLIRQAGRSGVQDRRGRRQRLLGNRSGRAPASGGGRRRRRHDGDRIRSARRASAGGDRRRQQLLHPGRCVAPTRNGARDIGRARRNTAPGEGPATRRPRDAVRRRARPDRSFAGARGDSAARNARRSLATSDRGTDRRPGVQRGEHPALERRAWSLPRCGRDNRRRCCNAGRIS